MKHKESVDKLNRDTHNYQNELSKRDREIKEINAKEATMMEEIARTFKITMNAKLLYYIDISYSTF